MRMLLVMRLTHLERNCVQITQNYLANFCQTFVNNISPRYKNIRYICKRFSLFDTKMKRCSLPDAVSRETFYRDKFGVDFYI